ncbi:GDSL family lipase [Arthrobacter agilis]|uniref:GDSL family lipase n=1 Tax=Arthrobacter agilis TaxID=37921 RepID=A0A2L0UH69_9MICC|nr:GDSL family lipase [Arthrobacter agilis]
MHSSTTSGARGAPVPRRRNSAHVALLSLGLSLGLLAGTVPPASAETRDATASDAEPPAAMARQARTDKTPGETPADPTTAKLPAVAPAQLPVGSAARNPATGRLEVVVPDVQRTAVLIGDSQSGGADTWPQIALHELGYSVRFLGAGGTGFVATNGAGDANYHDALTSGDWVLPHGDPALVVVEGGGNDARSGVSDGDILASANALILELERTYPSSRMVMIGTLSRSATDGGARRAEVDALLGTLASQRGIPFVSAGGWLTTHALEEFLADDVHLNPVGHQKAALLLEQDLAALKLAAAYTAVDPLARLPRELRPLE